MYRAGLALLTVAIGVTGAALVALGLSTPPRPNPERISAVVFTRPPGRSVRLVLAVRVDGRIVINAFAPRTGNRDPLPDIAIVLHGDLRLHGIESDQQLARSDAEVHDDVPCEDLETMFGDCQAGTVQVVVLSPWEGPAPDSPYLDARTSRVYPGLTGLPEQSLTGSRLGRYVSLAPPLRLGRGFARSTGLGPDRTTRLITAFRVVDGREDPTGTEFGEPDPQSELTVGAMVDAGTYADEPTADISEVSAEPPFDVPALRAWGSCLIAELCGVAARTVTVVPGGLAQGRSSNADRLSGALLIGAGALFGIAGSLFVSLLSPGSAASRLTMSQPATPQTSAFRSSLLALALAAYWIVHRRFRRATRGRRGG